MNMPSKVFRSKVVRYESGNNAPAQDVRKSGRLPTRSQKKPAPMATKKLKILRRPFCKDKMEKGSGGKVAIGSRSAAVLWGR